MIYKADPESVLRWKKFSQESFVSIQDFKIPDAFIPLSNKKYFSKFTEEEKKNLFYNFIIFTAEFFIILEDLLYLGFRKMTDHSKANRLVGEESLHTRAFRHYLRNEKILNWPENTIILRRNKWFSKFMIFLVKAIPLSISLPGAKIESYSVHYGKLLRSEYGEQNPSTWVKLNWLHLLDEAQHVGFEFDIYNDVFTKQSFLGKIKSIAGILTFYIFLQFILTTGSWRTLSLSIPAKSRLWLRLRTFIPMLYWASFTFPPAHQMRTTIKEFYKKKRPKWGHFLWVLWR